MQFTYSYTIMKYNILLLIFDNENISVHLDKREFVELNTGFLHQYFNQGFLCVFIICRFICLDFTSFFII